MADRYLAGYVTVGGETFEPGQAESDLPAGVAEKITHPEAWVSEEDIRNSNKKVADEKFARPGGTTSGHRLATHVTVGGETFGPEDHVPDDVAEKITNPSAWEGGKLPGASKAPKAGADGAADKGRDGEGDADPGEGNAPQKTRKAPAKRD